MQERFVVSSVSTYFVFCGFEVEVNPKGYPDVTCRKKETRELWEIEAKGDTQNTTVDFHTALGQLARLMDGNVETYYGIALPDNPSYRAKCRKISDWFRNALHLHWLLVQPDGRIRIIPPGQTL